MFLDKIHHIIHITFDSLCAEKLGYFCDAPFSQVFFWFEHATWLVSKVIVEIVSELFWGSGSKP